MTQREKAFTFATLHREAGAFVMANSWNMGTAKLLTLCGFKALATNSGGSGSIMKQEPMSFRANATPRYWNGLKSILLSFHIHHPALRNLPILPFRDHRAQGIPHKTS